MPRSLCRQSGTLLEQISAKLQIQQSMEAQKLLVQAALKLGANLQAQALYKNIYSLAPELCKCEYATLYVLDDDGKRMRPVVAGGSLSSMPIQLGIGIAGVAAQGDKPIALRAPRADPRFEPSQYPNGGEEITSLIAVPVFDGQREVRAVLECINGGPNGFLKVQEETLVDFAKLCGISLMSARSLKSAQVMGAKSERGRRTSMLGLAK